jgi:hypothetical protein
MEAAVEVVRATVPVAAFAPAVSLNEEGVMLSLSRDSSSITRTLADLDTKPEALAVITAARGPS